MRSAGLVILWLLAGACSLSRPISPPEMRAFEVSLATSETRAAIAWHGSINGRDAIHFQQLDARARSLGAPRPITDGTRHAYEPDLQFLGDDAIIAWYEKDPGDSSLTAWLARIAASGDELWRRQLSEAGGLSRNPVVRVNASEIAVAWIETAVGQQPTVWLAHFNSSGVMSSVREIARASSNTWNLNAAFDAAGRFFLVYDAGWETQENELYLAIIGEEAIDHIRLTQDDGFASVYPDIDISTSGIAAITWFDMRDDNEEVYLGLAAVGSIDAGRPLFPQRVSHSAASSIGAYLAWNADRLAVVWSDAAHGQRELFARMFDATGAPVSELRRMTHTREQSSIPSIRPWGNRFLVAWNEYVAIGSGVHRDIVSSYARIAVLE